MTIKNISSILAVGVASSLLSVSLASAMEMIEPTSAPMKKNSMMMKDDMKKGDTMMDDSMKKNSTIAGDIMMYEKITSTSSKEDVTKIQTMLVEKGHLVMPKGVAYGYYGMRTKAAYAKYKKASMMMKGDTMKKDSMMMKDDNKMDTAITQ